MSPAQRQAAGCDRSFDLLWRHQLFVATGVPGASGDRVETVPFGPLADMIRFRVGA